MTKQETVKTIPGDYERGVLLMAAHAAERWFAKNHVAHTKDPERFPNEERAENDPECCILCQLRWAIAIYEGEATAPASDGQPMSEAEAKQPSRPDGLFELLQDAVAIIENSDRADDHADWLTAARAALGYTPSCCCGKGAA